MIISTTPEAICGICRGSRFVIPLAGRVSLGGTCEQCFAWIRGVHVATEPRSEPRPNDRLARARAWARGAG